MNSIAYQNKDITSKVFAERFKGKSLKVYGLDIPKVKEILPTNIPRIKANELRIDNVFLLEDGSIAVIDYESEYKRENKHKYINYVNEVVAYYNKEWKKNIYVRMIVIYTADVKREQTSDVLDTGCLRLEIESAYLAELDRNEISERLNRKILNQEKLSDEELMEFIILPLTYEGKDNKNNAIGKAIKLVGQIEDNETKIFLLTGVAVFTDKIIDDAYAQEIWRMLDMTKVGQIFEEKLEEKAKKMAEQMAEQMAGQMMEQMAGQMMEQMAEQKAQKKIADAAKNLLGTGFTIEKTAECLNLSVERVREIAEVHK